MKKNIAIVGAGGFGFEVKMLIDQINDSKNNFNFIGFFDDQKINKNIIGKINDINSVKEELSIVIAIGDPIIKKNIHKNIINPFIKFETLIHPNVVIGENCNNILGEGCIITAGNIITVNCLIENFVTLNLACTVGHDTSLKEYSSFMPGVNISGDVLIEECVYVGTGATIINQLTIGKNTTIGAGAVVSKSLPENCVAVGVPARVIKYK